MFHKAIVYVGLVVCSIFVAQAFADDNECGSDVDLGISGGFIFTDENIVLNWRLRTPTDCPVQYHLTVNDEEFGVIRNDYLETTNTTLDKMSYCIMYNISLRAVNVAIPDVEGPRLSTTIRFSEKAQVAPSLGTIEAQPTSLNLTFLLEGDSNRCPLKNLYIDGGDYFNLTIPLADLTDRSAVPVQITSLKPSSMYYFRVYVENTGGLSPAAALAAQTLDSSQN